MSPATRTALRQVLAAIIQAAQAGLAVLSESTDGDAAESALAKIRERNEGRTFGDDHPEEHDG